MVGTSLIVVARAVRVDIDASSECGAPRIEEREMY
jgi:hypothetical protein